jgi:hypothetical protein
MAAPRGFSYQARKSGEVEIMHNGRHATTLRGFKASRFLADIDSTDSQQLMARVTGNYKRGNERR